MVEKILEQGINIIENAIVRMEKFATHMHTISVKVRFTQKEIVKFLISCHRHTDQTFHCIQCVRLNFRAHFEIWNVFWTLKP